MMDIEPDALHPTYKEIFETLGRDQEALLKIFNQMSGQQVNLPVHLYDAEAVRRIIQAQSQTSTVDVNVMSEQFGYSRRWVRLALKETD